MSLGDTVCIPPNFVLGSPEDNGETVADPRKVYIQPLAQISSVGIVLDQDKAIERSQYFGDIGKFFTLYKDYLGDRAKTLLDLRNKLADLGYFTDLEMVQIMGLDLGGCRKCHGPAIHVLFEELPSLKFKGLTVDQKTKLQDVLNEYCT